MSRYSVILVVLTLSCCQLTYAAPTKLPTEQHFEIDTVVANLAFPWSLVFLSDNQLLVTQRPGQLRRVVNSTLGAPIDGLPADLYVQSQGGLLDIALHPEYQQNGWIYLSYSAGSSDKNTLKVLRARLRDNSLVDQQDILTVLPYRDTPVHYGAKMAFLPDHSLLVTSGDGFDYREDAQRLNNQLGKILRVHDDGRVPADNPFVGQTANGLGDLVFSYGHRNPQGLVYDPDRQLVISHEHGPDGGDEVNIIRAGNNYGWPVITNGRDYSGASISPFQHYPGMQLPLYDWTPSIAPAGMSVYQGALFPQMRGDILVSNLKTKDVRWLQMAQNKVVAERILFADMGQRIRHVKVHPDGSLYLLLDSAQGGILRVTPKVQ